MTTSYVVLPENVSLFHWLMSGNVNTFTVVVSAKQIAVGLNRQPQSMITRVDAGLMNDWLCAFNPNSSVFDFKWQQRQRCAGAGSPHAVTILNAKQRAVSGTLDVPVADIHKLIRKPVQIDTRMWTAIFISVELSVVIDDKEFQRTLLGFDGKFPGGAGGDGISARYWLP